MVQGKASQKIKKKKEACGVEPVVWGLHKDVK